MLFPYALLVAKSEAGGAIAPSLSNAVDTPLGPTAATGSVDTDTASGTLYWVTLLSGDTTPSAAEVKAGQKAGGSPAEASGSQAVSSTGTQTLSPRPTLLAPATAYKLAFMHESGAQSSVTVADGFTTTAVLVNTLSGGGNSTTDPTVVTGSVAVEVGDLIVVVASEQTGAVTTTGVTDNLSNTYTAQNAGHVAGGIVAGSAYYTIATNAGTLTTVNVAASASTNDIAIVVGVFKGPFGAIDANPANRGDSSDPLTGTATGTLTQASELVLGWLAGTATGDTYTANSPFTLAGAVASGGLRRVALQYLNVEATTSVTPSFNSGASTSNALGTMSFTRNV